MGDRLTWYEFFAGGGMARLGLGDRWDCVFANEWCSKKAEAYINYFGTGAPKTCRELRIEDVANLNTSQLPGAVDLAWASFPCQDLSLAGNGAGLKGKRSGAFMPFWKLMETLSQEKRAPRLIVLENVVGALTSHEGKDFSLLIQKLTDCGYRVGGMVIDAVRFVPQSRPRLFIVGFHSGSALPADVSDSSADERWHTRLVTDAVRKLPDHLRQAWMWWSLPVPNLPLPSLRTLIEEEPSGVEWYSRSQTERIVSLMSPIHLQKLDKAKRLGKRVIGTIYKRTRPNAEGIREQRAEVRFDQISGCLRTPVGGSSRQVIIVVEGDRVRSRLLSPREAARLMGVPDSYPLPHKYNDAYHLFGDGVVVPVVSWLERHLLYPLAASAKVVKAA
ncbi:MAG TPA: DNA cytosine methyltransferase [Bryobacteraceae bacterium]|nr:DNA cytosine methyltransferase [Bryobacteraceae bacterium]